MKIFASGSWEKDKAEPYENEARKLGKLIAEHEHELITGPGTGISEYLVSGYREAGGKKVIVYLAGKEYMNAVGEKLLIEPDETIQTEDDYPTKNIKQVKSADAVIMITGGPGSLTEIIHAANDFDKPVACLDGSGEAIEASKSLSKLKGKIFYSKDVGALLKHVEGIQ